MRLTLEACGQSGRGSGYLNKALPVTGWHRGPGKGKPNRGTDGSTKGH